MTSLDPHEVVERLRPLCQRWAHDPSPCGKCPACTAADLIESLQARVEEMENSEEMQHGKRVMESIEKARRRHAEKYGHHARERGGGEGE